MSEERPRFDYATPTPKSPTTRPLWRIALELLAMVLASTTVARIVAKLVWNWPT
jgi:hypothetical protein